ncbi:hypothetical protein NW762_003250 [Fusarium torreyae]|uniref:Chromo domain-containing protein n=1 Tax=Fusarium torreyae TaxID=1237075 RepID=A0A9W8S9N3_9HYPO|nr:hypothetical protein NW762_003250 [Fusarium torreyae]
MDVIRNLFSSPRKQPAQKPLPPPTSKMSPQSKTYSKKEIRRASRGSDRYSLPEGRSPRSRVSNVSSITAAQDTTGDISYTQQQEFVVSMPPPRRKRISTGTSASTPAANSSPAIRRSSGVTSSAARLKSSPRVRSSPPVRSSPRGIASPVLGSSPANRSSVLAASAKPAASSPPTRGVIQTARAPRASLTKKNAVPQQAEKKTQAAKEEQGETRAVIKRIKDFRWNAEINQFRLLIEWEDGEDTWEDEEIIHADARKTLLAFWKSKGGRPEESELYQAFAVRGLRNDKSECHVEWVGYGDKDKTWEPIEHLLNGKQLVDEFLERARKTKTKTRANPKARAKAPTKGRTLGRTRVSKR